MLKRKVFLKVMILCTLFFLPFFRINAAVVTKMKKSTGLILIDGGKKDGFKNNEKVCFFNFSQVNMGCGRVRQLLLTKSVIKVTTLVANKIEAGFFARTKNMEDSRNKKNMETFVISPRLAIYYPIVPGVKFSHLGVLNPANDGTLFTQASTGPLGFSFFTGVEVDIRVINLTVGFNFLTLAPAAQEVEEAVKTAYSFSNRFFVDYTFYPHPLFGIGLGVQGNYHGIAVNFFDSAILDTEFLYKEDKMTFSLRVPLSLNVLFKPAGFFLRVTPTLNLFALSLGSSLLPTTEDRGNSFPYKTQIEKLEQTTDYTLESDIKTSLGFSDNIFSLDASLGFFVVF
jgi:hypothetical protein